MSGRTELMREMRNMDVDELEHRLSEAKQELFNLRFQHVTGQLDNTSRLSQVKTDIARLRSLLREQEIAAAEAAEGTAPAPPQAEETDNE